MKVLLINGSPHENGRTYTALSIVADCLKEEGIDTEILHIGNKPVGGCVACGGCASIGKCVFNDIVNIALEKAKEADGLIFGSPVYYASPNGCMLSFMDRFYHAGAKSLEYKPGACIASARRAGTTATIDAMNKYLTINNMPVVSSRYWNMVHGSSAADVLKDLEGVQIMKVLGKNMAWMLRNIEAGKRVGVQVPVTDTKVFTNFIR